MLNERTRRTDEALRRPRAAGLGSLVRSWRLVLASLAALCLAPAECGLESGTKDVGAPCTRDDECLPELECVSGVCASRNDGGAGDAG